MTYTSFVTGLAAMAVTGVTRKYSQPPSQLSSADLPAMYPRLPEGTKEIVTLTSLPGMLAAVCELVVVVNSTLQNNNNPNFTLALTLMDALNSALTTNAATLKLDRWNMRQEEGVIGDTPYWLIIARVEASE